MYPLMAGGTIPVINMSGVARPVHVNLWNLPTHKAMEDSKEMHAFFYKGIEVECQKLTVIETSCNGSVCDALDLNNNGKRAPLCPCFQIADRVGSYVFELTLKFSIEDSVSDVVVKHFTSKSITGHLMTTNCVPNRGDMKRLRNPKNKKKIYDCTVDVFTEINRTGGFCIRGWGKRGMVTDIGVEQKKGNDTPNESLNYHISSLVPLGVEWNDISLQRLKFDPDDLSIPEAVDCDVV